MQRHHHDATRPRDLESPYVPPPLASTSRPAAATSPLRVSSRLRFYRECWASVALGGGFFIVERLEGNCYRVGISLRIGQYIFVVDLPETATNQFRRQLNPTALRIQVVPVYILQRDAERK